MGRGIPQGRQPPATGNDTFLIVCESTRLPAKEGRKSIRISRQEGIPPWEKPLPSRPYSDRLSDPYLSRVRDE